MRRNTHLSPQKVHISWQHHQRTTLLGALRGADAARVVALLVTAWALPGAGLALPASEPETTRAEAHALRAPAPTWTLRIGAAPSISVGIEDKDARFLGASLLVGIAWTRLHASVDIAWMTALPASWDQIISIDVWPVRACIGWRWGGFEPMLSAIVAPYRLATLLSRIGAMVGFGIALRFRQALAARLHAFVELGSELFVNNQLHFTVAGQPLVTMPRLWVGVRLGMLWGRR